MSSILLQIDFKKKKHLSKNILENICMDLLSNIITEDYFNNNENIYMNYKILKKNKKIKK